MAKVMKKIFGCLAVFILFVVFASGAIFGVGVGLNYIQTGVLTYKVAPVTTIIRLADKISSDNKNENKEDSAEKEVNNETETDKAEQVQDKTPTYKENSLEALVDNVMPAIVSISCTFSTSANNDLYSNYFGTEPKSSSSSGSGFIIAQNSREVLIATNNHVVEDASKVKVTFNDNSTCVAEIKGCDSLSDLAVIAVQGKDISDETLKSIKIASLGNSDALKVGDIAIAIGNAMGYGQSVTKGVISALERTVEVEDSTMDLIQTDAAINPGNSGGALLNSRGEVIGINSVKYVATDTESVGYAIPITTAVPIINELANYEEISEEEQAYFGIVATTVSEQMASYFNCSKGAYVKSVSDDSPAQEAGIVAGDIIIGFAGRKITSMEELQEILKYKRGGDSCDVIFERLVNGKYEEHTVKVTFVNKGDN